MTKIADKAIDRNIHTRRKNRVDYLVRKYHWLLLGDNVRRILIEKLQNDFVTDFVSEFKDSSYSRAAYQGYISCIINACTMKPNMEGLRMLLTVLGADVYSDETIIKLLIENQFPISASAVARVHEVCNELGYDQIPYEKILEMRADMFFANFDDQNISAVRLDQVSLNYLRYELCTLHYDSERAQKYGG